ncbi:hypothetical protein GCM10026982_24380 [Nocardiopsis aegyptia]
MARDNGPFFPEEITCPCRVAGLQRGAALVQDEHGGVDLFNGVGLTALLPGPGGLGGDAGAAR